METSKIYETIWLKKAKRLFEIILQNSSKLLKNLTTTKKNASWIEILQQIRDSMFSKNYWEFLNNIKILNWWLLMVFSASTKKILFVNKNWEEIFAELMKWDDFDSDNSFLIEIEKIISVFENEWKNMFEINIIINWEIKSYEVYIKKIKIWKNQKIFVSLKEKTKLDKIVEIAEKLWSLDFIFWEMLIEVVDLNRNVIYLNKNWNPFWDSLSDKKIRCNSLLSCKYPCKICPIDKTLKKKDVVCDTIQKNDWSKRLCNYIPIFENEQIIWIVNIWYCIATKDWIIKNQNNWWQNLVWHTFWKEIFGVISHELKTPLNHIIWFSDLLKTLWNLNEQDSQFVDIINQSWKQFLQIIEDLIELWKLRSWEIKLNNERTNLKQYFSFLIENFKWKFENKWLNFSYSIDIDNIYEIDLKYLDIIMRCLIDNALKFTNKWNVKLNVFENKETNKLQIELEDSWVWIEQENIWRIFEEFFQESSWTNRECCWLWIWLSIVSRVMQLFWWQIEITSEKNKWTKVELSIPFGNNKIENTK